MEMLLAFDRRATRRSVLVDCQVVRERGFELVGERAVDLSMHGMLLCSKRSAQVGEELIVTLRVPGTRVWIDTMATVTRVVHGRRNGDRGPALGLAFDPFAKAVSQVYHGYEEALRLANATDFDDLLVLPVRLLQQHAAWHVLCAVAAYLLFRHYAAERAVA